MSHFTGPLAENCASTCATLHLLLRHKDRFGVICWCLPSKLVKLAWPTAAEPCTRVGSLPPPLPVPFERETRSRRQLARPPQRNRRTNTRVTPWAGLLSTQRVSACLRPWLILRDGNTTFSTMAPRTDRHIHPFLEINGGWGRCW